jgi:hypothetical protein
VEPRKDEEEEEEEEEVKQTYGKRKKISNRFFPEFCSSLALQQDSEHAHFYCSSAVILHSYFVFVYLTTLTQLHWLKCVG